MESREQYAVIGAGPCGIAMVRCLSKMNIPFQGFEYHDAVGGIWNNENPLSTVYDSAHLISSKSMTEFTEYPFAEQVADFPHNKVLKDYFLTYADKYQLNEKIRFNSEILKVNRNEDGTWLIKYRDRKTKEEFVQIFKGVILATGLFNKGNENIPNWEGMKSFTGEILHAANYKNSDIFADKKVLIVGCGNSAADIAIDAVHRAKSVDMSVRRGYYFVPKYVFGKPMDTVNGAFKRFIPEVLKKKIDKQILKWFAGDPERFGFPKPDYDIFESHPVINSYLLQHVGHGDIKIVKDIDKIENDLVYFKDGTSKEYDIILTATGYHIKFKYIDHKLLNWKGACPNLHLNIFHPDFDNLFVLGMVEATGIGWQGRFEQAELVSQYIFNKDNNRDDTNFKKFEKERRQNHTDLRNGMKYIKLDRMAYYVHKETYMQKVSERIRELSK
jgi:cation diffusion facilitator CzcD-associated flavoprotein CzcO